MSKSGKGKDVGDSNATIGTNPVSNNTVNSAAKEVTVVE
jgi:hypothetical protein